MTRSALAVLLTAILAAVPGCTERRVLSEKQRVGRHLPLDSGRVLTTVLKSVEYEITGLMEGGDESEYDTRFFILDPDSAPRPTPLKSRLHDIVDLAHGHPGEVLLSVFKRLDWRTDRILATGLKFGKEPVGSMTSGYLYLYPGPKAGHYLLQLDRSDSPIWHDYISEPESIALLGDGRNLDLLDMTYHGGRLWSLNKVDALRIRLAAADAESAGTVFTLPDTLGETHARVQFIAAQKGLWIRFKCGVCPPPYYFYLNGDGSGADWVPGDFDRPDSLLDSVWMTKGRDGETVYLHGDRYSGDSIRFDFSPFLK